MILYLSTAQVLELYRGLVDQFGGAAGLRGQGGLESAVARPAMTFGGDDLYPDLAAKGAALMHSLVMNHPFVDGNERIGVHAAEFFFEQNGHELEASDDQLEEITLAVAAGTLTIEPLTIWFRQRLRIIDGLR